METPPHGPDDTQPMPAQPAGGPHYGTGPIPVTPVTPYAASAPPSAPVAVPARFQHPFGNVGVYLLGRFGAFLIDIVAVTFLFATFGLQMSTGGNFAFGGHDATSFTFLILAALGVAALLLILSEGLFGTSLGKLVFALHVRRTNGNWAGPGRAFLRMLLRPIDIFLVGPILALVTPRHQRIGDFFAGTVVSRSRIGWLSTLLGLVILALAGYAQILYGGGVSTALAVAAESATYLPQFYRTAAQPFAAAPTASPYAVPTLAPQTETPPPDQGPAASSATEPAAGATDAPSASATDQPTNVPTDPAAQSTPTSIETG